MSGSRAACHKRFNVLGPQWSQRQALASECGLQVEFHRGRVECHSMTTTTTSPIDSLLSRMSHPGSLMTGPSPSDAELKQILGAAQRAADHGQLRPWRFIVVRPEQYQEFFDRLGCGPRRACRATRPLQDQPRQVRADAARAAHRGGGGEDRAEPQDRTHRNRPSPAAAATQLVLNGAHALRYKAFLFSGAGVFDEEFKAGLGLGKQDHLIRLHLHRQGGGQRQGGPTAEQLVREGLEKTVTEWGP